MGKCLRVVGAIALACCCTSIAATVPVIANPPVSGKFEHFEDYFLQLKFAQAMQTWANAPSGRAVTLSPALPTTCTWNSDTLLSCQLDGDLVRATRYRITLAAGLKTQAGELLPAYTLYVETDRPLVDASIEEWQNALPKIVVSTSQKSTAQQVASVLRIRLDDKPVSLPPLHALKPTGSSSDGQRFSLDVSAIGSGHLSLAVVPGLRSPVGPLIGKQQETLLDATVNEPFRLRGVTCAGPTATVNAVPDQGVVKIDCMPGETVGLLFSRQLDPASREALERSLPQAVKLGSWGIDDWRWHPRDPIEKSPAYLAELKVDAANAVATIELSDALHAPADARLQPATVRIRTGDHRPELRSRYRDALIADGNHPPATLAAVNAQTQFQVQSIGKKSRSELVQVSTYHHRNAAVDIISHTAAKALAEGGWARWAPDLDNTPLGPHEYQRQPVQFAAPDFDLFAVTSRHQVLAWANAWGSDEPISGAAVQLLWLENAGAQPRVVVQATTGQDGLALLELPPEYAAPNVETKAGYPLWLLRAADGTHSDSTRAVLPIKDTGDYGTELGRPVDTKLWGVADRPLYRAGDVVKYRLWQREVRGGRLLHLGKPQPLTLKLYNSDEHKTIREWQVTPNTIGAIFGDIFLPVHLTDATYCIGVGNNRSMQGICFFVGTYRAQDLWVEAKTTDRVLRDGDVFAVDIRAGYYSGGAAAGIPVSRISSRVTGLPLQEAYPQFGEYTFMDVLSGDARIPSALADEESLKLVADAKGEARAALPVRAAQEFPDQTKAMPAFGRLEMVAEVRLSDREATTSNAAQARYSQYDRFVGLRLQPRWFNATTPVQVQGMVIDAEGKAVANAPIDVDVDFLPGFDETERSAHLLTRCHLISNTPTDCNFQRMQSGRYRFTARSGKAATAEVTRYVWVGEPVRDESKSKDSSLNIVEAPTRLGSSMRLILSQPNAAARVLFVFGSGDTILGYRVENAAGSPIEYVLPVSPEWRRQVAVTAYVRAVGAVPIVNDGYRTPITVSSAAVQVPLIDSQTKRAPLGLSFNVGNAKPGDTVHITLHNDSLSSRDVVLAVMDDALRALADNWLPYFDPNGEFWLGEPPDYQFGRFNASSFGDWNHDDWRMALPLPGGKNSDAAWNYTTGATELDRITVTGSRIRQVELFSPGTGPQPTTQVAREPFKLYGPPTLGIRPPAGNRPAGDDDARSALARARTRFDDTALWQPDIRLAPGESRQLEFTLPDNLTRWRAIAWSSDADDDFDMAEATLESGLPVEVRLQTPVRIYPGDQARLAANVRQVGDTAVQTQTRMRVEGIGTPDDQTRSVPLAAGGQGSFALRIAPRETGTLLATALAETSAGRDAVAASVEVASPVIAARKVQAGWLGDQALKLDIPALPPGASDPQLQVTLLRGAAGLTSRWTQDMRDYPHRCWEQILSRAVAAALAIDRGDVANWPDAPAVVQEAIDNAAVFQSDEGDFRYFAEEPLYWRENPDPKPQIALTAYSVNALALLRKLGHPVAPAVVEAALNFLRGQDEVSKSALDDPDDAAFAASASDAFSTKDGEALWKAWDRLSLPAQVAATRAFAKTGHVVSREAMTRVLKSAPVHGYSRVLRLPHLFDRWMSSEMSEQCALIDLLREFPQLADDGTRSELIAGLTDLYAGGVGAVDTQTGAYCLVALHDAGRTPGSESASATLRLGSMQTELRLSPGQDRADWQTPLSAERQLEIKPGAKTVTPSSYIADLRYKEDARQARASAVGFSIDRLYDVLRGGRWAPIAGNALHEGDWLRITLVVQNAAPRYLVALTDGVPGGLRLTDLTLSSVAGLDLEKVSDTGSYFFGTRRLDPRSPRFYAEFLPAGRHEVHYFARASNAGDFLAAPATMELMYGNASNARTAASRLRISTATPP